VPKKDSGIDDRFEEYPGEESANISNKRLPDTKKRISASAVITISSA
jgi:hypothetical protein